MSQCIKTGQLRYFHRGLLLKKWKVYYFVLFNDSTLQWFEEKDDQKPEGSIFIRDIAQNLSVGPYTRCLPNPPPLPKPTDEANLIALPRSLNEHQNNPEIVWILCDDVTQLNDWMNTIVYTLFPAPPIQQLPPSCDNTTVVVQPIPTYSSGGWNNDNDTTIINNYYDVNNNNINQQQQQVEQNMIQTDTNNDQQTENTGVQQADYGEVDYNQNDNVDNTDYDNACEDYTTEEEDYNCAEDYGGGSDFGGSGDW